MITATLTPQVTVEELEGQVDNLDLKQAVAIYKRYGCLIVRGLSIIKCRF